VYQRCSKVEFFGTRWYFDYFVCDLRDVYRGVFPEHELEQTDAVLQSARDDVNDQLPVAGSEIWGDLNALKGAVQMGEKEQERFQRNVPVCERCVDRPAKGIVARVRLDGLAGVGEPKTDCYVAADYCEVCGVPFS